MASSIYKKGFTLIELIVSISLFTVVMTISMGSILSIMDANRKSQSLRSVMDNLNYSLESMTRNIRFGKDYHCDITQGLLSVPRDCSNGASSIAVTSSLGSQVVYKLVGNSIARSVAGGPDYFLTGTDVVINKLSFRVFGADHYSNGADKFQPRTIVVISGSVGTKANLKSNFTIETTISQRLFDSQ